MPTDDQEVDTMPTLNVHTFLTRPTDLAPTTPLPPCACGHDPIDHGGHPRSVGPCDVPWCRCARFDHDDDRGRAA